MDSANPRPPRRAEWPLAWRLWLPLALLVVVSTSAVTFAVIRVVAVRMDRAAEARLEELADSLVASRFALDAELLSRVHAVTAAEVLAVSPQGGVVASTLPAESAALLASVLHDADGMRFTELDGQRYRVVTRDLALADAGAALVVAMSTRQGDRIQRQIAGTIVAAAGLGLLVLVLFVHWVVRSATRPIGRLAEAAREVGQGDHVGRVPGGGGREVSALADAFNAMVDELARSREELLRAEKLAVAGRMAAGLAHEIRNPLSSIRMNIQLLTRRRGTDDATARELDQILDEIDRLDLVLGNLLDLTAPPRLRAEPHDLNALIERALRLTAKKLEHLHVEVAAELAADLPRLPLDEQKTHQAFLNVILNAAEAMPGGGTLRVRTRRAGPTVHAIFEDTGTGIDPGIVGKVFEPFASTKRGGAGLGLHVVKSVAELHGGQVRLEPLDRGGTRCVLEFPLPSGSDAEPDTLPRERTA
jgi:signal transduction histidine kinase